MAIHLKVSLWDRVKDQPIAEKMINFARPPKVKHKCGLCKDTGQVLVAIERGKEKRMKCWRHA
jgi:hypothetical protein